MAHARCQLRKLDEFLTSLLTGLGLWNNTSSGPLVLVTSDHGNIEDLSTSGHTTHPVPLLAWGQQAEAFLAGVEDLTGVAPAIGRILGLTGSGSGRS
jgi:phosphopentomutase